MQQNRNNSSPARKMQKDTIVENLSPEEMADLFPSIEESTSKPIQKIGSGKEEKQLKCPEDRQKKYLEREDGVYLNTGEYETDVRKISNFIVIPQKQIIRDNGEEQESALLLEGSMYGDKKKLKEITVLANTFSSMNWISKEWGFSPTIEAGQSNKDHMRAYIQKKVNYTAIPEETEYTHTGFRKIGKKWVYLYDGGALGGHNVQCTLEGDLSSYCFIEAKHNPKEAVQTVLALLKLSPPETSYPMLAFHFLAPLYELFFSIGYPPAFGFFLMGATGSFKTSLSLLYLSLFRESGGQGATPPANFQSTPSSLEKKAFTLKDSVLLVDDLHPTTAGEKRKMDTVLQRLSRASGDRASRGRMNSDTTLKKDYKPRGLILVTSEDFPDIGRSGAARFWISELEKGAIQSSELSKLQNKSSLLNYAMGDYILWISEHWEELKQSLKKDFEIQRHSAQQLSEKAHSRTPSMVAWMQVSINTFCQYCLSTGIIDEHEAASIRGNSWKSFYNGGEEQGNILESEKPTTKFLITLHSLLDISEVFVVDKDKQTISSDYHNGRIFAGYEDDTNFYFNGQVVYDAVKKHLIGLNDSFPVTLKTLSKEFAKENTAETGVRVTIKGTRKRYLVVPKKRFNDIVGEDTEK